MSDLQELFDAAETTILEMPMRSGLEVMTRDTLHGKPITNSQGVATQTYLVSAKHEKGAVQMMVSISVLCG